MPIHGAAFETRGTVCAFLPQEGRPYQTLGRQTLLTTTTTTTVRAWAARVSVMPKAQKTFFRVSPFSFSACCRHSPPIHVAGGTSTACRVSAPPSSAFRGHHPSIYQQAGSTKKTPCMSVTLEISAKTGPIALWGLRVQTSIGFVRVAVFFSVFPLGRLVWFSVRCGSEA